MYHKNKLNLKPETQEFFQIKIARIINLKKGKTSSSLNLVL
jgi:hypothetical protein